MYGGFVDRAHDLLLCGADPSRLDFREVLSVLSSTDDKAHDISNDEKIVTNEAMQALMNMASMPWKATTHAYLYGPQFKACLASVFLVKVHLLLNNGSSFFVLMLALIDCYAYVFVQLHFTSSVLSI